MFSNWQKVSLSLYYLTSKTTWQYLAVFRVTTKAQKPLAFNSQTKFFPEQHEEEQRSSGELSHSQVLASDSLKTLLVQTNEWTADSSSTSSSDSSSTPSPTGSLSGDDQKLTISSTPPLDLDRKLDLLQELSGIKGNLPYENDKMNHIFQQQKQAWLKKSTASRPRQYTCALTVTSRLICPSIWRAIWYVLPPMGRRMRRTVSQIRANKERSTERSPANTERRTPNLEAPVDLAKCWPARSAAATPEIPSKQAHTSYKLRKLGLVGDVYGSLKSVEHLDIQRGKRKVV